MTRSLVCAKSGSADRVWSVFGLGFVRFTAMSNATHDKSLGVYGDDMARSVVKRTGWAYGTTRCNAVQYSTFVVVESEVLCHSYDASQDQSPVRRTWGIVGLPGSGRGCQDVLVSKSMECEGAGNHQSLRLACQDGVRGKYCAMA